MNRRNLILGTSAGLALMANRALAQRSTTLISELTGGEVDMSGSNLQLSNQHIDESDGSEHMHFTVAGGQFDLLFWPRSSGESAQFVASSASMYISIMPDAEELGSDDYDDGGWVAFGAGILGYYEYQVGAYGDHDLIVTLAAPLEDFADVYDQAQAILLDGMPPFLFSEESDIVALAAERSAGTGTSASRTSRGSTSTSRNSRESTVSSDPVQDVLDHRSEFLASYDSFYAQLQIAADETASDREVEDSFAAMVNVAFAWQTYPTQAAAVAFTTDLSSLETVYLEWADSIGLMGTVFEDFYMGNATVDDYLAVHDEFTVIDEELLAILEGLGNGIQLHAIQRSAVSLSLAAARRIA